MQDDCMLRYAKQQSYLEGISYFWKEMFCYVKMADIKINIMEIERVYVFLNVPVCVI